MDSDFVCDNIRRKRTHQAAKLEASLDRTETKMISALSRYRIAFMPAGFRATSVAAFCFALTLFVPSTSVVAASSAVAASPAWTAVCENERHHFVLDFKSPSGDVEQDDMNVVFTWDHNNPVKLRIAPAWFEPGAYESDTKSLCRNVGGFVLEANRIVVLIKKNGRPNFDRIAAILIDGNTGHILSTINDVGELYGVVVDDPDSKAVLVTDKNGYKILLIREWRQDKNDFSEFGVPGWRRLTVRNNILVAAWDSP